jgi:hypothetical protein
LQARRRAFSFLLRRAQRRHSFLVLFLTVALRVSFFVEGARFHRSGLFPRPWRRRLFSWFLPASEPPGADFLLSCAVVLRRRFGFGSVSHTRVRPRRRGVFVSFLATAAAGPDSSLLRSARGEQPPPCPGFLSHIRFQRRRPRCVSFLLLLVAVSVLGFCLRQVWTPSGGSSLVGASNVHSCLQLDLVRGFGSWQPGI